MGSTPLVSIVVPTYNRVRYLGEALDSVFQQTFTDWELIVADDGSTDGTRNYLDSRRDPRLRAVYLAHTGNPSVARNRALELARGRYVAFLDSDDVWIPEKLEAQLAGLRAHPDCRWSYTWFGTIDADGRRVPNPQTQPWVPHQGMVLERLLTFQAVLATPSVMVDRMLLNEVGRFDETLAYCEDYDCWFRLAIHSPIWCENLPLTNVRVHRENHSRSRVLVYQHWERTFAKMAALAPESGIRALCRRQRALQPVLLARWYGGHGMPWRAIGALLSAVGYAAPYGEWWRALAKTILRPLVPDRALRFYRRLRP